MISEYETLILANLIYNFEYLQDISCWQVVNDTIITIMIKLNEKNTVLFISYNSLFNEFLQL